jgi:hypothetical protein
VLVVILRAGRQLLTSHSRKYKGEPFHAKLKRPETQRNCRCAAGASAHTPTARRNVRLPRLTLSDAAPTPEQPSRRHTQTRAAPFTSRADHQEPTRSAREVTGFAAWPEAKTLGRVG